MYRKFESLLLGTEANAQARKLCEEAFAKLKVDLGVVVGLVYVCDTKNEQQSSTGNQIIGNPEGSRKKGQRNIRRKSYDRKDVKHCKIKEIRFSSRNGVDISQPRVKFYSQS